MPTRATMFFALEYLAGASVCPPAIFIYRRKRRGTLEPIITGFLLSGPPTARNMRTTIGWEAANSTVPIALTGPKKVRTCSARLTRSGSALLLDHGVSGSSLVETWWPRPERQRILRRRPEAGLWEADRPHSGRATAYSSIAARKTVLEEEPNPSRGRVVDDPEVGVCWSTLRRFSELLTVYALY